MQDMFKHLQQTTGQPLFPEVLWNRPETKLQSGKLLIIGGNAQKFKAPALAEQIALQAGIGVSKTVLPEQLKKLIGSPENTEFAPGNRSGGLAKNSLDLILDLANWADGVLLAGDFGRNSETAILLEDFLREYDGQVTVSQDANQVFMNNPELSRRPKTLMVLQFNRLQKLASKLQFTTPLTSSMPLLALSQTLHEFSTLHKLNLITTHQNKILLASNGQVGVMEQKQDIWQIQQAAWSSVFWLQQPETTFKTLMTSLLQTKE